MKSETSLILLVIFLVNLCVKVVGSWFWARSWSKVRSSSKVKVSDFGLAKHVLGIVLNLSLQKRPRFENIGKAFFRFIFQIQIAYGDCCNMVEINILAYTLNNLWVILELTKNKAFFMNIGMYMGLDADFIATSFMLLSSNWSTNTSLRSPLFQEKRYAIGNASFPFLPPLYETLFLCCYACSSYEQFIRLAKYPIHVRFGFIWFGSFSYQAINLGIMTRIGNKSKCLYFLILIT